MTGLLSLGIVDPMSRLLHRLDGIRPTAVEQRVAQFVGSSLVAFEFPNYSS